MEVTVDEAIQKGQRMVNYPVFAILIVTITASFFLSAGKLMPFWTMPVGLGVAFVSSWLYWSFMITKWRLWAFENVRNVHELKKRAIREKLIWKDDSFFEKTEIRSATQKEKWDALKDKFSQEDIFHEDLSVPAETMIYFSKNKNFMDMALMLGGFALGIYFLLIKQSHVLGTGIAAVCGYLAFKNYKEATNTDPQIILNSKGIQTKSTEFYSWSQVYNEEAVMKKSGKHSHQYLVYDYPGGSESLQLDDFDTDLNTINKLLILYRGRYNKQNKNR